MAVVVAVEPARGFKDMYKLKSIKYEDKIIVVLNRGTYADNAAYSVPFRQKKRHGNTCGESVFLRGTEV